MKIATNVGCLPSVDRASCVRPCDLANIQSDLATLRRRPCQPCLRPTLPATDLATQTLPFGHAALATLRSANCTEIANVHYCIADCYPSWPRKPCDLAVGKLRILQTGTWPCKPTVTLATDTSSAQRILPPCLATDANLRPTNTEQTPNERQPNFAPSPLPLR